jgi:hypothetical protein
MLWKIKGTYFLLMEEGPVSSSATNKQSLKLCKNFHPISRLSHKSHVSIKPCVHSPNIHVLPSTFCCLNMPDRGSFMHVSRPLGIIFLAFFFCFFSLHVRSTCTKISLDWCQGHCCQSFELGILMVEINKVL